MIEFLFHVNGVKESCNFEKLLHAKWYNFDDKQKKSQNYEGCSWKIKKLKIESRSKLACV